ncbi:MAG: hypothetical protein PVF74_14550 [Anaerolineales bacterium]
MTAKKIAFTQVIALTLLLLPLSSCRRSQGETRFEVSSTPTKTALATPITRIFPDPSASPNPPPQSGSLTLISPQENIDVSGGSDLRIVIFLADDNGLPIEGASVQAELWSPSGELYTSIPCLDHGAGNYLSEYVRLPKRGAGGSWRVLGNATWGENGISHVESEFRASPSISEMYQERHGFWVEHPSVFGLGTGFYNLSDSGGLHFEDWLEEDGSGYVILDNYRYKAVGVTFATIEVHWRDLHFPTNGEIAIDYAQSLSRAGLHHQDPESPLVELTAIPATFQGRPAWHVLGQGTEYYVSKAAAEYPIEWLHFQCPGSDWLWTMVLSTDHQAYLNHLQALWNTFECPKVNPE